MGQLLLLVVGALVVAAIGFGVAVLLTGSDPGLGPAEPDGPSVPLPTDRPLTEEDFVRVRFDVAVRGYRMAQVDAALRRAAYDVGYKEELITVLLAEVEALRAGRAEEAEALRETREAAVAAGVVDAGRPDGPPIDLDPAPVAAPGVDGDPGVRPVAGGGPVDGWVPGPPVDPVVGAGPPDPATLDAPGRGPHQSVQR
jgi:DivIVA domain-containing protein